MNWMGETFHCSKRAVINGYENNFLRFYSSHTKASKKSKLTAKYIQRQMKDEYVAKAREHSYRARSAFKLIEINSKYKFLNPGSVVVDVGCAPGSWCQVANEFVNQHKYDNNDDGYVLGIDLQPILPLSGVDLIQLADVRSPKTHRMIKERLKDRSVDVVLSDMAPNPSGDKALDHDRIVSLCEELIRLCCDSATNNDDKPIIPLKRGGTLLCKIWDGQRKSELIELLKTKFTNVANIKPNASRDHSAELYLLARNRK